MGEKTMIGYLRGEISHLFNDYCFIDVQGVGYRVFIPDSTRQKLVINKQVLLFTYLAVREDALLLYGFFSQDEYDLFLHLLSVSGIGPKVAISILSSINPNDFRTAISQQKVGMLTKLPGIGKKTAERMILELKDKIGNIDEIGNNFDDGIVPEYTNNAVTEAFQALTALGYNQHEIAPILKKCQLEDMQSAEKIIKFALKEFSTR
jgi:Holliday junction DNA helicase RuvA